MSEKRELLNGDSAQTVIAVCFVLALLSVTFNFYNFNRLNHLQSFMAMLNNHNIAGMQSQLDQLNTRLEQTQKRVLDLQTQLEAQEKARTAAETMAAAPDPGTDQSR